MLVLSSDHGGFELKEQIKKWLIESGYEVCDCGTDSTASVDYPVFAKKAAQKILSGECERGIIFCGTGIGISMAANRFKGIRAAVCETLPAVELCRKHNNANILCLGGRLLSLEQARQMVQVYLTTPFDGGERHERRIAMLDNMEGVNAD